MSSIPSGVNKVHPSSFTFSAPRSVQSTAGADNILENSLTNIFSFSTAQVNTATLHTSDLGSASTFRINTDQVTTIFETNLPTQFSGLATFNIGRGTTTKSRIHIKAKRRI